MSCYSSLIPRPPVSGGEGGGGLGMRLVRRNMVTTVCMPQFDHYNVVQNSS